MWKREGTMGRKLIRSTAVLIAAGLFLAGCASAPPPVEEPIAGDFQAWADFDRSGALEREEMEELIHAVRDLLGEPHPVGTPVDEYFDFNGDGGIGPREREMAIHLLLEQRLINLRELIPPDEPMPRIVDFNGNGRVDDGEMEALFAFLFHAPELREPHDVGDFPLDRIMDRNENAVVEEHEIRETVMGILWIVAVTPFMPREELMAMVEERVPELLAREAEREREAAEREAAEREREAAERGELPPVRNFLDELADLNGNGVLEPGELEAREIGLAEPHPVETEFDRRIDFNEDGEIEDFEIRRAVKAGEFVEPEGVEAEVFPVRTMIDELIDLNGDGRIDAREIEIVINVLTGRPVELRLPEELLGAFDPDGNGSIDRQELLLIRERFLRPHPVDPDFPLDEKLDRNEDGFVGPEEIGVAAGVTEAGEIPSMEEMLERIKWREELPEEEAAAEERPEARPPGSDFYRKLGEIQDKKLAVVGLTSTTRNVDSETADGIVVFVENAFVNVGKVNVVDRQNIAKIVQEYEFQQTDLTDESTAVEIGKLSGANIIVIGSVSYVGKRYYLNIKLISVETGEIMGSSIADAEKAEEFLEMCNEAVYTLF